MPLLALAGERHHSQPSRHLLERLRGGRREPQLYLASAQVDRSERGGGGVREVEPEQVVASSLRTRDRNHVSMAQLHRCSTWGRVGGGVRTPFARAGSREAPSGRSGRGGGPPR